MKKNRYVQIIESIFFKYYSEGATRVPFQRSDIIEAAKKLGIKLPKNVGDLIYSFRYRSDLPQSLLAKIRYNRLVDIFTGLTCYSLQNHLRTTAPQIGQVETDEIYIGIDKRGAHYVLPVQAKGGTDKLGIVQFEQDMAVCLAKFPNLICKLIAAQFMRDNIIAIFELEDSEAGIVIVSEKHYRLLPPDELSPEDLKKKSLRSPDLRVQTLTFRAGAEIMRPFWP